MMDHWAAWHLGCSRFSVAVKTDGEDVQFKEPVELRSTLVIMPCHEKMKGKRIDTDFVQPQVISVAFLFHKNKRGG